MAAFCILLAPPRSGTNALGEAVARSFRVIGLGEIFHSQYADPTADYRNSEKPGVRANFFNFRHETFRARPYLSFPSSSNIAELFSSYISFVSSLAESQETAGFLLDIKYTSMHHLEPYWRLPFDSPNLLKLLREHLFPVVHLRRKNLFSLYCSQKLAEITGIWWTDSARSDPDVTMTIDIAECIRFMDRIRETEERLERWLSGNQLYRLTYEDIFRDG